MLTITISLARHFNYGKLITMFKIFGFRSKQAYPIIYPPLAERINRAAKDKSEV